LITKVKTAVVGVEVEANKIKIQSGGSGRFL
jgi:hypothetical protein